MGGLVGGTEEVGWVVVAGVAIFKYTIFDAVNLVALGKYVGLDEAEPEGRVKPSRLRRITGNL